MRLGIDLGTTNTVLARDAVAIPLSAEAGPIVPSVVAYLPNGKVVVGSEARRRRAIDPVNTIFSSKRMIGRRWAAAETEDFRNRYPFELEEREGHPVFVTRAGKLAPEDIAAAVLGFLFDELRDEVDVSRDEIVIAVPAGFAAAHRQATVTAAHRAGAVRVELIEEPLATTRAYRAARAAPLEGTVGVYDLGGGTFELAVVSMHGQAAIKGTASDLYLGGDDIDRALANLIAEETLEAHRWDFRDDPIVFDRLVMAAEQAKCALSTAATTTISLADVDSAFPGDQPRIELRRDQLDSVVRPIIRQTFISCDEALASAGVGRDDLSALFLAGGSSQLPIVTEMVRQYFGVAPERAPNLMELVAIGASIGASG